METDYQGDLHVGDLQEAIKKNRRGRAMGGMVMGIGKEMAGGGLVVEVKGTVVMVGRVTVGKEKWRVVEEYVRRRSIEETLQELDEKTEGEKGAERTIMGGALTREQGRKW